MPYVQFTFFAHAGGAAADCISSVISHVKPVSMRYVKQRKVRLSAAPEGVPLHRSAASFHVN
jgi:hypothetical protein